MKKRILSALLAALMIIGSVGTFAIGASAADDFTLSVVVGEVQSDNTVHVQINMKNCPGIAGIALTLEFDNSVVNLLSYDKDEDDYLDTVLRGDVTSNIDEFDTKTGEPLFDSETANTATYVLAGTSNQKATEGKLVGFNFRVVDPDGFTELNLIADCSNEANKAVVPTIENSHIGVLPLEGLSFKEAAKTVVYDGNKYSLEIVGLDNKTMTVVWTYNGVKTDGVTDAGEYAVKAVVSKAGYADLTLNGTLTINKAQAKLVGVELWSVAEGGIPEIKSMANAAAQVDKIAYPVNWNNLEVVKDGDTYNVTGVTVANANVELDTTVVPNVVSADEIVQTIVAEADIVAPEVHPTATKLPNINAIYNLPYGYTLELVPVEGIIAEDGTITRPEETMYDVAVTYKVLDSDLKDTGVTVGLSYTIYKKSSDDSTLAMLLLYYNKKLEDSKKQVETVQASVATGSAVAAGTAVTLSTATEGATIHYTTDGTTATVLSPVYTGAIVVNEGMTINAIAKKNGMVTSGQASFVYTIAAAAETSIELKADAANIKYMDGRGDKFEPEANATRYEVIKALANVFDITTTNAALELTDVDAEYKELVDLCTAAGIIKGYDDKTFKGNDPITRAEVATIICNIMGLDVEGAESANFTDVSGWATNYVNACANAGYVQGMGDGTFAPSANITRAQLATIINNITGAKEGTSCSYDDVVEGRWYYGIVCAAAK